MLQLIKFYTFRQFYTQGQIIDSQCNTITFYNAGTNSMIIDGVTYAPSQSISFVGNVGEYTEQQFTLSFVSGAGTNNCVVYRKTYTNTDNNGNN